MTTKTIKQEPSTAQTTQQIRQLLEETYPAHVRSGDAAKYASMYSEEALWMPPGVTDRQGAEGVREGTADNFQKFDMDPILKIDEIEVVNSDVAYALGKVEATISPKDGSDPMTVNMRVMWLLRREAGEWKIFRQIWNNKP